MPKQPESRLQREIRRTLEREFGGFWFKTHGSEFQIAGLPDLIGVIPGGIFCGVEVKRPGKDATPQQLRIMKTIRREGGIAFVAKSPEMAINKMRRALSRRETIKEQVIRISKTSSSKSVEGRIKGKRFLRSVHVHGDRKDNNHSVPHRKVVATTTPPSRSRRMS